jgi:signal peptidase II
VISLVFIVYLLWLILRIEEGEQGYLPALGLLLGGFTGNGIDRLRNGYVTDFIYITAYPSWMPSTFNVADLAILLGITWLLGRFLWSRIFRKREAMP